MTFTIEFLRRGRSSPSNSIPHASLEELTMVKVTDSSHISCSRSKSIISSCCLCTIVEFDVMFDIALVAYRRYPIADHSALPIRSMGYHVASNPVMGWSAVHLALRLDKIACWYRSGASRDNLSSAALQDIMAVLYLKTRTFVAQVGTSISSYQKLHPASLGIELPLVDALTHSRARAVSQTCPCGTLL